MITTIRKTAIPAGTEYTFGTYSRKFLVKNFSEGDILVSFEPDTPDMNCAKVGAGCAQCFDELFHGTGTVYVKGDGEVEIQEEF